MPKCSCKKHDDFCTRVYKLTSKKYRVAIINKLRERGLLSNWANYLCTGCAQHCEQKFLNETSVLVDQVVDAIEQNKLSQPDLLRIASALGKSQYSEICEDTQSITTDYQSASLVQCFSEYEWLKKRNVVLVTFLGTLCNIEIYKQKGKILSRFLNVIENVYALRSKTLVLPLSFCKNLLTYFLTGSKNACLINSVLGPCGSFQTILKWINCNASVPLKLGSSNNVITYFDNNQVISRNWRLRHDAKALMSITTTVVHFISSSLTTLQSQEMLSPRKWLYTTPNKYVVSKILELFDQSDSFFRTLRRNFIQSRLNFLIQQQNVIDGEVSDFIDVELKNRKHSKQDDARDEHEKSRQDIDVYCVLEHAHMKPPSVIMGDPIPVNPCSFSSVKEVLLKLREMLEISNSGTRQWSIVGCDGLPYHLAWKVIEDDDTLKDILLQPGLGHYEMNMTKVFIKLIWDVVGSDLAKMLGFRTPKALSACQQANDHHKAWQMFEILLYGTGDELLIPYIRECLLSGATVTVDGFFSWTQEVSDPNYRFLLEAIFTYAVALFFFRVGVRRNNNNVMLASRMKFTPLFYGFHKVNYQQIDFVDLKTRVSAPPQVSEFLAAHETFSVSGFFA